MPDSSLLANNPSLYFLGIMLTSIVVPLVGTWISGRKLAQKADAREREQTLLLLRQQEKSELDLQRALIKTQENSESWIEMYMKDNERLRRETTELQQTLIRERELRAASEAMVEDARELAEQRLEANHRLNAEVTDLRVKLAIMSSLEEQLVNIQTISIHSQKQLATETEKLRIERENNAALQSQVHYMAAAYEDVRKDRDAQYLRTEDLLDQLSTVRELYRMLREQYRNAVNGELPNEHVSITSEIPSIRPAPGPDSGAGSLPGDGAGGTNSGGASGDGDPGANDTAGKDASARDGSGGADSGAGADSPASTNSPTGAE